jgi:flavin-dependent dehydrogenase
LNKSEHFDAVIVGAGVAGCAAAHYLIAAGWQVALLHRGDDVLGTESLPPAVARKLDEFSIRTGTEFNEVIAWWGSDAPALMAWPGGRIVQRAALAQEFRGRILETGARLIAVRATPALARNDSRWHVGYQEASGHHRILTARYIVDASGRSAVVGRALGARRESADSLCCLSISLRNPGHIGVWTESVADGWWNFCSDGEEATLSFYSTPKIIRETNRDISRQFSKTKHTSTLTEPSFFGSTRVRPCGSSILLPCAGPGWMAVGDSAMTLQPLASAGIATALKEAGNSCQALNRPRSYNSSQQQLFRGYLIQLTAQYDIEKRWTRLPLWTTARFHQFGA